MKRKTVLHYVDNKKFYDEIVKYRKRVEEAKAQGKEEPRIPDYIGECIWKISEKLSTKPCFINYSYREEMVSDAIENCILYFKDYDPDYNPSGNAEYKANPFAYFTQIVYFAFLRRINKEEKNRYIIYKNFQETVDMNLLMDSEDNSLISPMLYDNINHFMEKFERKEELKKAKRKQVKEGLDKFIED